MIRVVIDTNVLVSALLQPQGLPARVVLLTIAGPAARLCVSGAENLRKSRKEGEQKGGEKRLAAFATS